METVKIIVIPLAILLLGLMSWFFEANGMEGTFVTSVQSLFIAVISGWVLGKAVPVSYKGYKTLRKKK